MFWHRQYTKVVIPDFNFEKNKKRIEAEVNKRLEVAGVKDPGGFTLLENFVTPVTHVTILPTLPVEGKLFPQVAVIGNTSGIIYYFYLDKLFPGEGLD